MAEQISELELHAGLYDATKLADHKLALYVAQQDSPRYYGLVLSADDAKAYREIRDQIVVRDLALPLSPKPSAGPMSEESRQAYIDRYARYDVAWDLERLGWEIELKSPTFVVTGTGPDSDGFVPLGTPGLRVDITSVPPQTSSTKTWQNLRDNNNQRLVTHHIRGRPFPERFDRRGFNTKGFLSKTYVNALVNPAREFMKAKTLGGSGAGPIAGTGEGIAL